MNYDETTQAIKEAIKQLASLTKEHHFNWANGVDRIKATVSDEIAELLNISVFYGDAAIFAGLDNRLERLTGLHANSHSLADELEWQSVKFGKGMSEAELVQFLLDLSEQKTYGHIEGYAGSGFIDVPNKYIHGETVEHKAVSVEG